MNLSRSWRNLPVASTRTATGATHSPAERAGAVERIKRRAAFQTPAGSIAACSPWTIHGEWPPNQSFRPSRRFPEAPDLCDQDRTEQLSVRPIGRPQLLQQFVPPLPLLRLAAPVRDELLEFTNRRLDSISQRFSVRGVTHALPRCHRIAVDRPANAAVRHLVQLEQSIRIPCRYSHSAPCDVRRRYPHSNAPGIGRTPRP